MGHSTERGSLRQGVGGKVITHSSLSDRAGFLSSGQEIFWRGSLEGGWIADTFNTSTRSRGSRERCVATEVERNELC